MFTMIPIFFHKSVYAYLESESSCLAMSEKTPRWSSLVVYL